MRREFPVLTLTGLFQYASRTAPGPNGKERYAHLASRPWRLSSS